MQQSRFTCDNCKHASSNPHEYYYLHSNPHEYHYLHVSNLYGDYRFVCRKCYIKIYEPVLKK